MSDPYRKPGKVLPDRPTPPAVYLPRPPGNRMWVNMLHERPRKVGGFLEFWEARLVEALIGLAMMLVLVAAVVGVWKAELGTSDSARNPNFCSCPCDR